MKHYDFCDVLQCWGSPSFHTRSHFVIQIQSQHKWNFKWLWFYFLMRWSDCFAVRQCVPDPQAFLKITLTDRDDSSITDCCVCLYLLISSLVPGALLVLCWGFCFGLFCFFSQKSNKMGLNTFWLFPFLMAKTKHWIHVSFPKMLNDINCLQCKKGPVFSCLLFISARPQSC